MVLLLPVTVPSLRGLITWLKLILRHTSRWLKTVCPRLVLAFACNASTRFRIIESNDGQRRTSVLSWEPSKPYSRMPEPYVMESSQIPATNGPGNLAITNTNTSGFIDSDEVQDENQGSSRIPAGNLAITGTYTPIFTTEEPDETLGTVPPNFKLHPILASSIQKARYDGHPKHPKIPEGYSYSYPASPGVPDFSEYGSCSLFVRWFVNPFTGKLIPSGNQLSILRVHYPFTGPARLCYIVCYLIPSNFNPEDHYRGGYPTGRCCYEDQTGNQCIRPSRQRREG